MAEPSTDSTASAAACAFSMSTLVDVMSLKGPTLAVPSLTPLATPDWVVWQLLTVTFSVPVALPLLRQMESSPLATVQLSMRTSWPSTTSMPSCVAPRLLSTYSPLTPRCVTSMLTTAHTPAFRTVRSRMVTCVDRR